MTEQARAMAVALRTTLLLVLSPLLQKPLFGAQNGRYRHGWVYSLLRGYYRLLAHPTSFPGQWHPNHPIRWDEAMRLRPPQPDSPSSGSSANWALNPLYALPHPNGSAHSTPLPA